MLAVLLAAILYFKPWKAYEQKPPRFFDRLPEADIIGKSKVLDLSRSLSTTLYHYKIPLREFFSQEFILGQGKSFGLDLQKPVYFFINQKEWKYEDLGVLLMVSDSSKVRLGIEKLKQHLAVTDTIIEGHQVYVHRDENAYMTYGENWMLLYTGDKFNKTLKKVINARFNEIPPKWRNFLNKASIHHNLQALIAFDELRAEGIDHADIVVSNDSTGVTFQTSIRQTDTVSIGIKQQGQGFPDEQFTKNNINLHLDISRLRNHSEDPIHRLLKSLGKKISFPTQELLNAWEGDLAFRQGGLQTIEQRYVQSVLDEDFNITEVTKVKHLKIQGFSIYLSMNRYGKLFLDRMFSKGILTKNEDNYRLLFSPPMSMLFNDSSLVLYTGKFIPGMNEENLNRAIWTHKNTAYEFYLDSISTFSIYSRIRIPLDQIVKENLPQQ